MTVSDHKQYSNNSVTIIGEAGVNHNGDVGLALELVDVAAEAGCDVVKFQTFKSELGVTNEAAKAAYQVDQRNPAESQKEMLARLELSDDDFFKVLDRCKKRGVAFLSSPFDLASLKFLVEEMDQKRIKVASSELLSGPLLFGIGRTGVSAIVSTGMSTLEEISMALGILAHGYLKAEKGPGLKQALAYRQDPAALAVLKNHVSLLHCTSMYPTPPEQVNLRAIQTLRSAFDLPTGYSDHTLSLSIPCASVACGATILEKHFTLSRDMPGPDHAASLEPEELARLVRQVREIETAMGVGTKSPTEGELEMRPIVRKSLVANCDISAGEILKDHHIAVKRPGTGISSLRYWEVLGRKVTSAFSEGQQITFEKLSDEGEA